MFTADSVHSRVRLASPFLIVLGTLSLAAACGSHSGRTQHDGAQTEARTDLDAGADGNDAATNSGPRVLVSDLGDKTLSLIRDGQLYFKPGFFRIPLSVERDADGRIPLSAVEKIWPEANPFAETWFVDDRAYWIGTRSLFSWPVSGGEVQATELPAANCTTSRPTSAICS